MESTGTLINSSSSRKQQHQSNSEIMVELTSNRPVWHEMSDTGNHVLASNFEPELGYDKETLEAIKEINWRAGGEKAIKNKTKEQEKFKAGEIAYLKEKEMYVTLVKSEGDDRSKWHVT